MPKVSINILTKNRAEFLKKALASVVNQSFKDIEVVVVNDGSTDETAQVILGYKDIKILNHQEPLGITQSRQEALEASKGEYVAILDDDDEWVNMDKLKKQAEFLDANPDYVLVGGGMKIELGSKNYELRMRPQSDRQIRRTMLLRNNFFTSTIMFRKEAAVNVGGFIKDNIDLCEDYDLWLRLGKMGKMHNFQEVFTRYRLSDYNKHKFKVFLQKQLYLANREKKVYPWYFLAKTILRCRLLIGK